MNAAARSGSAGLAEPVEAYPRPRRRRDILTGETRAAVVLGLAALAALVWANAGEGYDAFWATRLSLGVGPLGVGLTAQEWVNKGLMAIFLLLVGLDIKRALTLGELRLPGRALLPAAAAVGGLVVPAFLYLVIAMGTPGLGAWGSVVSTDAALALGALAVIGPRRAPRLRLFLMALAVMDSIGALVVIVLFYTASLDLIALGAAALGLMAVWVLARCGAWRAPLYLLLAVGIWYAVHRSGLHPALTGALIALLLPVYPARGQDAGGAEELARLYRQAPAPGTAAMLREALASSMPLNQRLSFLLRPYVGYVVLPLFVLANAGARLGAQSLDAAIASRVTWAVIIALVVGKLVGVTLGAALVLHMVPQSRLPGLDLPRIMGVGAVSGMGLSISLLVSGIALEEGEVRDQVRIGVLCASAAALVLATLILRLADHLSPLPPTPGRRLRRGVDEGVDLTTGDPRAPRTLIAYADMSDEGRWRLTEALHGIAHLRDAGQVRLVLRHKLSGPQSLLAALALEAARHQDKSRLWPFHDTLARRCGQVTPSAITRAAQDAGLDDDALWERIESGVDEPKVLKDALEVEGLTEDGGPVVYIDGKRFEHPPTRGTFSEALNGAREREPG